LGYEKENDDLPNHVLVMRIDFSALAGKNMLNSFLNAYLHFISPRATQKSKNSKDVKAMQSGIHPGGVHELEMLSGGYDATVLHQSTHPKQERVGPLSSEPIILAMVR
jgi:hypothetical protein